VLAKAPLGLHITETVAKMFSTTSIKDRRLPGYVYTLTNVLHILLVIVSLSIAFRFFDNTLFAWHPVFMSIGYILFMAEGVISSIMFRHLDGPERMKAIWSHALLQLRAVFCIAIGFGVIYRNKVGIVDCKQHLTKSYALAEFASSCIRVIFRAPKLDPNRMWSPS
jgi:hypothetical protein